MRQEHQSLEHIGFVKAVEDGKVKISLVGGGCTSCHNSLCMLGESKAKEVEVKQTALTFRAGEEVLVRINPSSGYMAVGLLYLLPFLLMMAALWFAFQLGYNEGIAGLSSILVLLPYFGILYLLKKPLGRQCKIDIAKR